jgi:hypothetical protein
MKRTVLMLVLTLAFGIVLGVLGNQALNAQQEPVKRTVLQKVDLGDKEGTMYVAELAPGASSGKHFHPGPESIYLLGGTMTLEKEGHPDLPPENWAIPVESPARLRCPPGGRPCGGSGSPKSRSSPC